MSPIGIEIERKFRLRTAPVPEVLAAHGAIAIRIEQVYLAGGREVERIRRSQSPSGEVTYRRTRKRRIGAYAFEEREEVIDEATWATELARADTGRRAIRKTRHVVPLRGQRLEIDLFDDPAGLAMVEVELEHEDEPIELPPWLGTWREVTGDDRYFNASLARRDAEVPPW